MASISRWRRWWCSAVVAVGALGGCATSVPWPGLVDLDAYETIHIREGGDAAIRCAVAGGRLAHDGLYLDLILESDVHDAAELRRVSGRIAYALTWSEGAQDAVEVTDLLDQPVEFGIGFARPLLHVGDLHPSMPPSYVLPPRGETARIIQVSVLGTGGQLGPGLYNVRIVRARLPEYVVDDSVWIDPTWRAIELQVPAKAKR